MVIDSENGGVPKHLGQIADTMCKWKGPIAEELGLTRADVVVIAVMHHDSLRLQV